MSDSIKPVPPPEDVVDELLEFYKTNRIAMRYKTMEILRATVKIKAVKGTNSGRYSVVLKDDKEK